MRGKHWIGLAALGLVETVSTQAFAQAEPPGTSESDELAALEAELAATADVGAERKLDLYGFADFTYTRQLGDKSPLVTPFSSFAVGNFNLYLSTEFARGWKALAEVRFLFLPNGSIPSSQAFDPAATRVDTATPDSADVNRPLRWGGIEIERIWLEYSLSALLTLRVGHWLTPYGIWNVDHGSPAIIGVYRPYVIGEGWFPERQTGIEAYGSSFVDATELGYHLTLSNGRGPSDAYQDLDENKAVGARLFVRNDSLLGTFTLGVSAYRGTFSDPPDQIGTFDPGGGLIFNPAPALRYDELATAADLKWEWEQLLVQSELVVSDVAYPDARRPTDPGLLPGPPGVVPDSRRWGAYLLVGYRTPWWNLMPFAVGQFYRNPLQPDARELELGVNVRPLPEIVLKAEFVYIYFPPFGSVALDPLKFVTTQAAWSF